MTDRPRDRYDQEIERVGAALETQPDFVHPYWAYGEHHSPLFDGIGVYRSGCSCITQIRAWAITPPIARPAFDAMQEKILADSRLPAEIEDIAAEHLPLFAEYQREADAFYNREAPPMLEENQ